MTSAVSPMHTMHHGMGLIAPCRSIDIDLADPVQDIVIGAEYRGVLALVCDRGEPIGSMILPVRDGTLMGYDIVRGVRQHLGGNWLRILARRRMESPLPRGGIDSVATLIDDVRAGARTNVTSGERPLVSVIVCTRERTDNLAITLRALAAQQYPSFEVVVVDNAPSGNEVEQLVTTQFAPFRCVVERRPGLSRARNRGIASARGTILAFTDDDASPGPAWLARMVDAFAQCEHVGAVTGLTAPRALDFEPQVMVETHRSFNRGYLRYWYRANSAITPPDTHHYESFRLGAGVNMAIRRDCFDDVGLFDEELGAGSTNRAGEDTDFFFRLLEAGWTLVYEPAAVVRHYHRTTWDSLAVQWAGWTRGYVNFLVRTSQRGYRRRWRLAGFSIRYAGRTLRALIESGIHGHSMPARLVRAEAFAALQGLGQWFKRPGPLTGASNPGNGGRTPGDARTAAVRLVDLSKPVKNLDDVERYAATVVHVSLGSRMLGSVRVANRHARVTRSWLLDEISHQLGTRLFADSDRLGHEAIREAFVNQLMPARPSSETTRPANPHRRTLSVVIATRDRPGHLRECLDSLAAQVSDTRFEIIVVDNNPASGQTRSVVDSFSGVTLLEERVGGASAARNRGIRGSRTDLVAMIDDDVVVPPHWVNMVLRAFSRTDVCAITGNVMPRFLETPAQALFEVNYGFGRGFDIAEFGPQFFEGSRFRSPPVSSMGAGAMICVRRSVLDESGLFLEKLGPGTPARAGEDLYFLYSLLKTSWTLSYMPHVYGFHTHRADTRALRRQIFNYGVGYYAHLTATACRDRDLRSILDMVFHYPLSHVRRLLFGRGRSRVLILLEWAGNLYGPIAYLASTIRSTVRRRAESDPDAKQASVTHPPAQAEPAARVGQNRP